MFGVPFKHSEHIRTSRAVPPVFSDPLVNPQPKDPEPTSARARSSSGLRAASLLQGVGATRRALVAAVVHLAP